MEMKDVTVTITYERRIKELTSIISQCQLIEELIKGEIAGLQSGAAAAIKKETGTNE